MNNKGFSLVEISMVVMIIAFIVASVTVGNNIYRNFKARKMINEVEQIRSAVDQFVDIYKALPGDFTNAYNIWGSTCGTNDIGTTTSCNGNGNNFLEGIIQTNSVVGETLMAWRHLYLAEIVPTAYTGTAVDVLPSLLPGTNIASSSYIANSCYGLRGQSFYGQPAANMIEYGLAIFRVCNRAAISSAGAFQVDSKSDDGLPQTGNVQTNGSGNCINSNSYTSSKDILCFMGFYLNQTYKF